MAAPTCVFCHLVGTHALTCRLMVQASRPDYLRSSMDAIRQLDLHLADCDGPIGRGILAHAIAHLEASLLEYLTGTEYARRRLETALRQPGCGVPLGEAL